MPDHRPSPPPRPAEQGFTVLELLVTLVITVAIMTVILTAVDLNANITRVQSDVSDLQQSTRVAQRDMHRLVRMAGRGGIPRDRALGVIQDASSLTIGASDEVVDGTDVVIIRGCFASPVYRVDSSDPTSFVIGGTSATLTIDSITKSAFEQPLDALEALYDADDGTTPEAILLVGSQGEAVYAVVEMTNIALSTVDLDIQNQSRTADRAVLTVSTNASEGGHAGDYLALNYRDEAWPDLPPGPTTIPSNLTSVAFACVLEEHQFFIRLDHAIPSEDTSPLSPKLARARMIPGTNLLHPGDGIVDIADNVFDLQLALGIDLDSDGRVDSAAEDGTPLPTNTDEWLWNDAADDESLAWNASTLQHVRLTILGQAQTADRQYIAPAIAAIENHSYAEVGVPTDPGDILSRRYRRRLLQSTIDLRNL